MAWLLARITLMLHSGLAFGASPEVQRPKLIYFNSTEGAQLLKNASHDRAFWQLADHFATEVNGSSCGPTSAAVVLNALGSQGIVAPPSQSYSVHGFNVPPTHYWELSNLNSSTCAQHATAPWHGALNQVGALIGCADPRLHVKVVHARNSTVEAFRVALQRALSAEPLQFVIVNFDRKGLDQEGFGHHSPVGAYDVHTDRVLILDVARYRYPPAWVLLPDLFVAMAANYSHPEIPPQFRNLTKNLSTPRGYLTVEALPISNEIIV
eukprot:TRINITY_DN45803_c0_g1_i1.p1 TRINITY_DN45803_c0_g1~~TRINITY_DN45803_c0_g1_i1.p1  ORF type:complete len:303 (-),score=41.92 TRINITY_DN45803_c0_g1_i1:169-966(-)